MKRTRLSHERRTEDDSAFQFLYMALREMKKKDYSKPGPTNVRAVWKNKFVPDLDSFRRQHEKDPDWFVCMIRNPNSEDEPNFNTYLNHISKMSLLNDRSRARLRSSSWYGKCVNLLHWMKTERWIRDKALNLKKSPQNVLLSSYVDEDTVNVDEDGVDDDEDILNVSAIRSEPIEVYDRVKQIRDFVLNTTSSQRKRVYNEISVSKRPQRELEILIKKNDVPVLRKEFSSLENYKCVVDEIINFYMKILQEECDADVYIYRTQFFSMLRTHG